jgi:hydroxypyruvate isomerase
MFNEVDFMDRFKLASQNGFKGVEYLFPYDYSADDISQELSENGLKQILFDLPAGDWGSGDRGIAVQPDRVGEFQDSVGKAIDYADALNCERITCLAGIPDPNTQADLNRRTLVDNLKFAAKSLNKKGITLLIEALNTIDVPGFYLTGTDQAVQIISDVSESNLKLQYDVYHMQIMEGDLLRTIVDNFNIIKHFQIADNPGRHEPGTGEINYKNVFNKINELGYDGWIGCEYNPLGDTVEGLDWLAVAERFATTMRTAQGRGTNLMFPFKSDA